MKRMLTFIIAVFLSLLFSGSVVAQKGMGEDTGIVRQGLTPSVTSISGELLEIKSGP